MEIRYSLPPVNLNKQDVEWLWREIIELFETPEPNHKSYEISIRVGKGSDKVDLQESDLQRLLQSAFLRKAVTRLAFSFQARYRNPQAQEYRSLSLSVENDDRTQVRLEGNVEWVHTARDRLSTYLSGKSSHSSFQRRVAFILVWLLPEIALSVATVQRPLVSGATILALLVWTPGGLVVASNVTEKMYPLSTVTIDSQVEKPWYTAWAHQLVAAVVIATIAGILVSLFFH